MSRTTEKDLYELAKIASSCIEQTGLQIDIEYSYGTTSIAIRNNPALKKDYTYSRLDVGLTMKEAANWLRAFSYGCQYGKKGMTNPQWKWEKP